MGKVLGVVLTMVACGPMPEEPSSECGRATCSGCCTTGGRCVASCGSGASCTGGTCMTSVMPSLHVDAGLVDAGLADAGLVDAGVRAVDAGSLPGDAGAARDAGVLDAGVACPRSTVMPQNHAFNGNFECGGALPFQSSGGGGRVESIVGRTGRAVRFTVAAGLFNNEFTSTWRFQVSQAGTWCASAFVKGTASVISMRLYLGPPGTAAGEVFDLPGPLAGWARLPPTLTAVNAMGQVGDEGFLVFLDRTHTAGATIEVDDVDVWRSTDGQCRESR